MLFARRCARRKRRDDSACAQAFDADACANLRRVDADAEAYFSTLIFAVYAYAMLCTFRRVYFVHVYLPRLVESVAMTRVSDIAIP